MIRFARSVTAPLSERAYRLLWFGDTLSSLGNWIVIIAAPFAVLQISNSPTAIAAVLIATLIPRIILTLFGGVWADRIHPLRTMLGSDATRCLTQAVIALLLLTNVAELWHLVVLAVVYGSAAAFFNPAATALVPATISENRLQAGNALLGISRNASTMVGPALGGLLVGSAGPGWAYLIDAATFGISAWFLAALMSVIQLNRRSATTTTFFRDLVEGWHAVSSRSWVWISILYFGLWNLAVAPIYVLGPVVANKAFGGALAWGVLGTVGGVGALIGGVVAAHFHPQRALFSVYLLSAPSAVILWLLGHPSSFGALVAAFFISNAALSIAITLWSTLLQQLIPRYALSRVSSYDWLGSLTFQLVGYVAAGVAGTTIGIPWTFSAAAIILLASTLGLGAARGVRSITLAQQQPLGP